MNDTNEEVNDMGHSVIFVFQYIYYMPDIIMAVHTHEDITTDYCVSNRVHLVKAPVCLIF